MERTDSGFYVVDVLNLKQPAGKPFHVEARIRGRSTVPGASAVARHNAFIEDRVRRLRRRTSHVRAVCAAKRMRENGDKSAKKSRITETLEVAERNRRTILERQVRSCAEAVAHAKRVAREQSERLAELTAARRAALEERLRITALRRQRLLTIPRSRLLEPQPWDEGGLRTVATDAVISIQQWWRRMKVDPLVRNFLRFGVSLDKSLKTPFEKLVRTMQSPSLIKAVGRLLMRLDKMTNHPSTVWKNPSRVFLSAYMLAAHPEELMPTMGPEEEALSETAQSMIREFESWIAAFEAGRGYQQLELFWKSWAGYYDAFQSWKEQDSRKIVDGMIAHFIELERLWLSVKNQVDADTQWAPRITEHQRQLHDKLSKFGETALQRLAAERDALRADFEDSIDTAATADILSTSPQTFPSLSRSPQRRTDSVSPSRSPSSSPPVVTKPAVVRAQENMAGTSTISQSSISSMEHTDPQISAFGVGNQLSNAQLAHELVMDPEFQLKPVKRSELEEQVRTLAKKAFFDSVRQDFIEGKFSHHVPVFIAQIRDALLAMVSENGKFAENIKEVLDVEHIKQQLDNNAFDFLRCLSYITEKMLQLCAPIRDAAIRSIALSSDIVTAFEHILDILEDMKLDLANYRLQALRPILQQQAVEYERTKFDEALIAGAVTLERTAAWLATAVNSLQSVTAARNPENIQTPENRIGYEDAYNEALLNLIFSNTAISLSTLPETLLLDADRLFGFQNEGQAITIVAALVMLSKNAIKELRDNRPAVQKLKQTLFILLRDKGTTIDNLSLQVISTINDSLSRPSGPPTRLSVEQESLIRSMVEKTLSYRDPVFSLLSRRIQFAIRHQLEKGVFKRESLASHGLDIVQSELESLSRRVCLLAKHNKEVYAKNYDSFLEKVVQ
ncbi:uncharacterized protein SPPG_09000 [Spizellomyces punctatus DAOM BR117]|uniref:T-complex protein 11 n=1 Tax=Spizellomyces punctatus (strain DAOM BR117) TaxID=645134 RepID=A0A0L0HQ40_SPIPD|nr:uncharacterized protein SPPG_09000 [Spizellomyces punctatus DAOM BR117]KND03158.1 hypothetical protein SPPG_09000 [Spizellomyces punctatus DAOM BR117]|eukprot:XP_016611197.1 hypothetical protein SPPG_09000 [Spizellomyces punctatus DAOM BR117]